MEASPSSSDSVVNMAGPSGNLLSNSHSRQQLAEDEVIVAQALQICAVCKVDTNSSNLNYGAPTCLSCRAFFRRIIQQKLKQELKCRSGGKCVITLETRKKCKRCRFEACLKVGMKPDSVLDENQYQRRFRKMISKQQQHIMEKQQTPHRTTNNYKPPLVVDTQAQLEMMEEQREEMELFVESVTELQQRHFQQASPSSEWSGHSERSFFDGGNTNGFCDIASASKNFSLLREQSNSLSPLATTSSSDINNSPLGLNSVLEDFPDLLETSMPILTVDEEYLKEADEFVATQYLRNESAMERDIKEGGGKVSPRSGSLDIPSCIHIPSGGDEGIDYGLSMLDYSRQVRQSWIYACEQVKIRTDFTKHLLSLHRPGQSLTKTLLRAHLDSLAKFFHVLAYQQPDFLRFSRDDQQKLLRRNTRLFIQYFLGRFFFAGSGYKQHQWLLLCQVPDYLNDATYLRFIPMTTFDGLVHLFRDNKSLKRYEDYAKALSDIALHVHCNSVVALACLFNYTNEIRLEAQADVDSSLRWVYESAGWASDKFNCASKEEMRALMQILGNMSDSFDQSIDWREDHDQGMLAVPDTLPLEPDESTIKGLLRRLEESFNAVPLGEDLVRERAMFNLDVPFSKQYLSAVAGVWAARGAYVQTPFVLGRESTTAATECTFDAAALWLMRQEVAASGSAQIEAAFGAFDRDLVNRKFALLHSREWVKVSMRHLHLADWQLERFRAAVTVFAKMLEVDNTSFNLLVLITLLVPSGQYQVLSRVVPLTLENLLIETLTKSATKISKDIFAVLRRNYACLREISRMLRVVAKQ